ncbi:hypothetical protein ACFQU2_16680 [Siccirubricoccus deserti]|uniref:hypothetical protein n=1 Tax=Siccirubricoccus deserti TaxID=2013562 RepID=UPI001C94011C|nr:hypothetical protein [Siccirubricoccus deserti]
MLTAISAPPRSTPRWSRGDPVEVVILVAQVKLAHVGRASAPRLMLKPRQRQLRVGAHDPQASGGKVAHQSGLHAVGWTTTASTLAAELGRHGLRAVEFSGRGLIPDESDMVSSMSLIATGLMPIDKMPGMRSNATS